MRASLLLLPLLALGLSACSAQQMEAFGQSWRHSLCNKTTNGAERVRCLEKADDPYKRG